MKFHFGKSLTALLLVLLFAAVTPLSLFASEVTSGSSSQEESSSSQASPEEAAGASSSQPPPSPTPAPANLPAGEGAASGISVKASSYEYDAAGTYKPENAIDGDRDTFWHGQWTPEQDSYWIEFQLTADGTPKWVESVTLYLRRDQNMWNPTVQVSVSDNGVDFIDLSPVLQFDVPTELEKPFNSSFKSYTLNKNISHIRFSRIWSFWSLAELEVTDMDPAKVDLVYLQEAIDEAKILLGSAKVGAGLGQYPQEAADALGAAITTAETAAQTPTADHAAAKTALDTAMDTFKASRNAFGKQDFIDLLQTAEAMNQRVPVGTGDGQCPSKAKEDFEAALVVARAVDPESLGDEELLAAYDTLQKALSAFVSSIISTAEPALKTLDLAGTWQFAMAAGDSGGPVNDSVQLPGTMDENKKGNRNTNIDTFHLNRDYTYTGPATYQRSITIPADWQGKQIALYLERTKKTRVWLNDTQVGTGQDMSLTAPHEYDLTGLVQPGGTYTLTVEVDNSFDGLPNSLGTAGTWCHQTSEETQTNWNGIVGRLELQATPGVRLANFQVRPDAANHLATVTLTLRRSDTTKAVSGMVDLAAESWNHEGTPHRPGPTAAVFQMDAGVGEVTVTAPYPMGNDALLWSEFSPALYTMQATVRATLDGVASSGTYTADFGLRDFTTDGYGSSLKQFRINGLPITLRGEVNCCVFPETGYPPTDLASWLRIMQTYKDYGLNHVRFHTWVPPQAAFKAADQLGLYIQFELPQWGKMYGSEDSQTVDPAAVEYFKADVLRMFKEYRNSPSAVLFTQGNELNPGLPYYLTFVQYCRGYEPDLLYSDIAGHCGFGPTLDFGESVYKFPGDHPGIVNRTNWDYSTVTENTPLPEIYHELGQLQVFPNFEADIAKYAAKDTVLKPRNLEAFYQNLIRGDMADMGGKFHRSSAQLSALLYRYLCESYLRTPNAGGFQLLGLQDFSGQGTALVGMLDAFFEPKDNGMTPEEFRQSCSELTVLAQVPQYTWRSSESFTADIKVANYSAGGFSSGIRWVLEDDEGQVVESGTLPSQAVAQGKVTDFGTLSVSLAGVTTAQHLSLHLSIEDMPATGAPYAVGTNVYDLWVYPDQIDTDQPDNVELYREFGPEAMADLQAGKNVLIISPGTKADLPKSTHTYFRPDFWSPMFHQAANDEYTLGSYIDAQHPLFKNFPTGEFADFQWYDLTGDAYGIQINGAPANLKPLVQPISTIERDTRLALLMEAKVAKGKLMICTIDLLGKTNSAPAQQLLSAIYQYMEGDEFQPVAEVEADSLRELVPGPGLKDITMELKRAMTAGGTQSAPVTCWDFKGAQFPRPAGATLAYESSDPAVASVAADGTVTAKAAGLARITATLTTAEGERYTATGMVEVDPVAYTGTPLDRSGWTLEVTSTHATDVKENMLDGNTDTYWHSAWPNLPSDMPQEVIINLGKPTAVSAIRWDERPNYNSCITKATIYVSDDGIHFIPLAKREIRHTSASDFPYTPKYFAFEQVTAQYIKLSATECGDRQASVAITELYLYNELAVIDVQDPAPVEVRYGTPLAEVLKDNPLPASVSVALSDESDTTLPVEWMAPAYQPFVAGDYVFEGSFFHASLPNPNELRAEFVVTVLPKNMNKADMTPLIALMAGAEALKQADYTADSWAVFEPVRREAKAFIANTNAVQHDADIMLEKLQAAIAALVAKTTIAVSGVALEPQALSLKTGETATLTATLTPLTATNKAVTWKSSAPSIAGVDKNGTVTAKKAGTATITVTTADGGFTAQCLVTVTDAGASGGSGSGSGGTGRSPQTGDDTNLWLWGILGGTALLLLLAPIPAKLYKRKRHKD